MTAPRLHHSRRRAWLIIAGICFVSCGAAWWLTESNPAAPVSSDDVILPAVDPTPPAIIPTGSPEQ